MTSIAVLKFGGAALSSTERFGAIANLIIERSKQYAKLVIVVSAMADTTDRLLTLARQVHPNPPQRECDMLISAGERMSISLLAMALALKGKEAVSFTGSQSGMITTDEHLEAKIVDVRPKRLFQALSENKIVIVAGFQGMSLGGEITTLGRGGSDTSAVALAIAIGADVVEFYKDVPGIYTKDPKIYKEASYLPFLSYEKAWEFTCQGAKVLSQRSVALAWKNAQPLFITSFNFEKEAVGTWIQQQGLLRPKKPIYEID